MAENLRSHLEMGPTTLAVFDRIGFPESCRVFGGKPKMNEIAKIIEKQPRTMQELSIHESRPLSVFLEEKGERTRGRERT
jgi:hypothetical protein